MNKEYSARMTGAGFLLYELKVIAQLVLDGVSEIDIEKKVYNENIFQYSKPASIKRIYPLIKARCSMLPSELLQLIIDETVSNAKLINLLAIMEEDALFRDFMIESVGECYKSNDLLFGKANVNRYFNVKAEQSDKVESFKDSTRNKLRQVYLKILVEAGLLDKIKDGELQPISIDGYLQEKLFDCNYKYFVSIMEGK